MPGSTGRSCRSAPQDRSIEGVLCYPSVEALPITPDLAVICTPPETVPDLIRQLGERGTKAAVVITAGFGELGAGGQGACSRRCWTRRGRTCCASSAPTAWASWCRAAASTRASPMSTPLPGELAFVTQSGAVVTAVARLGASRAASASAIWSRWASMADVDFGDLLDYLAGDPAHPRHPALRRGDHPRPQVHVGGARRGAQQAGHRDQGRAAPPRRPRAAASHTGALAGSDVVYDAAFRRAGMLRVRRRCTSCSTRSRRWRGRRRSPATGWPIVTNGGGVGVMATDALIEAGGRLAALASRRCANARRGPAADLEPRQPGRHHRRRAGRALRRRAARRCWRDRGIDALLVINCPTAVADSAEARARLSRRWRSGKQHRGAALLAGRARGAEARRAVRRRRHPDLRDAGGGGARLHASASATARNQELLMEAPASTPRAVRPDATAARAVIDAALAEGRDWLGESEAKAVLRPTASRSSRRCRPRTPMRPPRPRAGSAIRWRSRSCRRDITHKSDVGGVGLDLATPEEVRAKARRRMLAARPAGHSRRRGSTASRCRPMAQRPRRAGADRRHGATIRCSGRWCCSARAAPRSRWCADRRSPCRRSTPMLARELMAQHARLRGCSGLPRPPAGRHRRGRADVLIAVVADARRHRRRSPSWTSTRCWPTTHGVLALDARIRVAVPTVRWRRARLAIRPYPKELEERVTLNDGRESCCARSARRTSRSFTALFEQLDAGGHAPALLRAA